MNRFTHSLILVFLLLVSAKGFAQLPVPASENHGLILIKGGTLHTGDGKVVEDALILISDDQFVAVGSQKDSAIQRAVQNYRKAGSSSLIEVFEVNGHIYPGLIAPNTKLGITEIDRVRATRDYREVGVNNANVRSIIAYNAESKLLPTMKYNGILLAEIAPSGFLVSGQSSVVELDAWNWEDASYKTDIGIHINWPSMRYSERAKKRRKENIGRLEMIFQKAKAYSKSTDPDIVNLKYEAMRGLFDGSKKAFVHANNSYDIIESVQFMKRHGVSTVIVGAAQAAKVAGFLSKNDVAVIFVRTQSLPSNVDADYDEKYRTPKVLADSNVLFCIADKESWQQRNLPFQAGSAVAFGLSKEQALAAITSSTAKILGLGNVGVIAKGKDATFVVSEGDILDMSTNNITHAFIRGKLLDMTNHQELLYKKYMSKYKLNPD
jgi:imidazolonepropionase-like amidohydrolase